MSLVVVHEIQLLFISDPFLHTEILTAEVMQGSQFRENH